MQETTEIKAAETKVSLILHIGALFVFLGLVLVFKMDKPMNIVWVVLIFLCIFLWVFLYTEQIKRLTIAYYNEDLRQKLYPNLDDVNEAVDPIIFKGAGTNRSHMHPFTKGGH